MLSDTLNGISWEDTRAGWTPETLKQYRLAKFCRTLQLKEEHKQLWDLANLLRMEIAQAVTERLDLTDYSQKRNLFTDEE